MPHNFQHLIHNSHRFETEFSQVFVSRTIRSLGASIISIFVPIFIYQAAGSNLNSALPLITLYHAGLYLMRGLFTVYFLNLIARFGGKHILVVSAVLDAAAYILLAFLEQSLWLLGPIALLLGLSSAAFFAALHMELSFSVGERKAKDISTVEIARKISMSLGPLVGGLIAGTAGILYATLLAAVLFFASAIPLQLRNEPLKATERINKRHVLDYLFSKPCRGNYGMGLNTISAMLVWPFYIFLFLDSYQKVGIIVSASLILAIIIMHVTGAHEQDTAAHKQVDIGAGGSAITHILRAFVINPLTIGFVNLLNDISYSFLVVPYTAQYYRNASVTHHRSSYVAAMEISFAAGEATMWFIPLITYYLLGDIQAAMLSSFVVAALGVAASRNIYQPITRTMA